MKNLKVYKVGLDPIPVIGAEIAVLMGDGFSPHGFDFGIVDLNPGDFHDTIESALSDNIEICTSPNISDFCNDEYERVKITVDYGGKELIDGMSWIYAHELESMLDDEFFPFQDFSCFQVALKEKWCEILEENEEDCAIKNSDLIKAYEEKIKEDDMNPILRSELWFHKRKELTQKVKFGNNIFTIIWISVLGRDWEINKVEV